VDILIWNPHVNNSTLLNQELALINAVMRTSGASPENMQ